MTPQQEIARADLLFAQGMALTADSPEGAACSLFDECVGIRRERLGSHLSTARALYRLALSRDRKPHAKHMQLNSLQEALKILRNDAVIRDNADLEFDVVARTAMVLVEIDSITACWDPSFGYYYESPEIFGLLTRALRKLGMRSNEQLFGIVACQRELLRRDLDDAILTLASWFGERSIEVADACITRANIDFGSRFCESRDHVLKWQMTQHLLRALAIKSERIGNNCKEVAALNRKIGDAFDQMQMPEAANEHYREATRIERFNSGCSTSAVNSLSLLTA